MNKEEKAGNVDWANFSDDDDEEAQTPTEKVEKVEGGEQRGGEERRNDRPRGNYQGGNKRGGERRGPNHSKREKGIPKESQPREELLNLINRSKDDAPVIINIFDVEYSATEDDVRKIYPEVKIGEITAPKKGIFLLELSKEEALKIVDIGAKVLNNRQFFMKMGYATRPNYEENYHDQNRNRNKNETGYRDNRPGKKQGYNRKENQEDISPGFKKPFEKRFDKKPREDRQDGQPQNPDPNDKYFKNHNPEQGFNVPRFTRNVSNKEENKNPEGNVKPNPFGDAKPSDQIPLVKTESKEERKADEPKLVKEESTGNVPDTPTNTPIDVRDRQDEDSDPKLRKQYSGKRDDNRGYGNNRNSYGNNNQKGSSKGFSKGGSGSKEILVYQEKPKEKRNEAPPQDKKEPPKQSPPVQKSEPAKKKESTNKKNPFDMLNS